MTRPAFRIATDPFVRPVMASVPDITPGLAAVCFVAAHVPLALLMHAVSVVTFIHAALTVGCGLWIAACDERPERAAPIIGYIAGSEVLWRMTNDRVFWEMAKYATVAIASVALFRMAHRLRTTWPMFYVAALLPSALLTLAHLPFSEATNQLSFNMSGPIALAVAAMFFGSVDMSAAMTQRVFVSVIAAVTGIAAITAFTIVTNPDITFSHQSNFALSGGFGPNQVSAAIGLGAFMAVLLVLERQPSVPFRLFMLALVIWFSAQSALTFSRGGMFCTLSATLVAAVFYARDPRSLASVAGGALAVGLLAYFIVWPRLDNFTGGNLSMRFSEADTSLRADLSAEDIDTFKAHPFAGVGPGMSKLQHLDDIISHTEFTRLLAEHGGLGLIAMVLMAYAAFRNIARGSSARERAIAGALMTWAVLFMSNSAMRLVAPAFTFGLACAVFASPQRERRTSAARAAAPERPRWRLVASS